MARLHGVGFTGLNYAVAGSNTTVSERLAELVATVGSAPKSIVRYAKDNAIDMIVMGTHSRGFWSRMLRGSVSGQVVKKSPCPVVLCPPQLEHAPAGALM